MSETLSDQQLELIDGYWRASNYLTVGQIYLMAIPLLREPLRPVRIVENLEDIPAIRNWKWTPD